MFSYLMDLFQNIYHGCQEQVPEEEAFTGTDQEMIYMAENELMRLL